MSDLIDRKSVIDAITNAADKWDCPDDYQRGIKAGIRMGTLFSSVIPSAQPRIIHCRDCKYAEVADKEDSQDGYTCQFHRGSIWFGGSYCSWAERREVSE